MLKLNVLSLLKKAGKTKYWLYKRLGMSYQNFNKMVNNETTSIRYEVIDEICLLLNCEPNDLFCKEETDKEDHDDMLPQLVSNA